VAVKAGLGGAVAPAFPVIDVEAELIRGGGLGLEMKRVLKLGCIVHVSGTGRWVWRKRGEVFEGEQRTYWDEEIYNSEKARDERTEVKINIT